MDDLRALTFVQPYATLMMLLGTHPAVDKCIENRQSSAPSALVGKRFAIHAGVRWDKHDDWGVRDKALRALEAAGHPTQQTAFHYGCLLGTLELVGFVRYSVPAEDGTYWTVNSSMGLTPDQVEFVTESHWRDKRSKAAWLVRDPKPLAEPIHCGGIMGFWRVLPEHLHAFEVGHG